MEETSTPNQLNKNKFRTPWWVHILAAIVIYVVLTYGVPFLHSDNKKLATFLDMLPNLAPIGAIGFLLLGAKALYDGVPDKQMHPQDEEKISSDKG